jgi:hypothetical protein
MRTSHHAAIRIPVETQPDIGLARLHFVRDMRWMQRSATVVDIAAVGARMQQRHAAVTGTESPEELRSNRGRRTIRAVGDNLQRIELEVRNTREQELNIVIRKRGIVPKPFLVARVEHLSTSRFERSIVQDLFLHCQFNSVGELESIGTKQLDAVVAPRIVRGRNHHAGLKPVLAR